MGRSWVQDPAALATLPALLMDLGPGGGSVADLYLRLVSLIKAKSTHQAAGAGRLLGKENLMELFNGSGERGNYPAP